jgi:hypothetical protein
VDKGKDVRKERMKVTANDGFQSSKRIPGLDPHAAEKSTEDKNLAPLTQTCPETFQYGNTSIASHSTDHPDWTPGECLNLQKYTGIFRVKISRITQKVS